ncbi:uncharacterized protein KY384_007784 [Bacidia gigantensis]|uniref:uncharacterized protein n=1 Tax=Bacidia gigantensis TaxID=2732470 RepID=UPI001D04CBA6|nr:uncharacterized protein KY384_007784 [Bacidia gigantensis]KAG8527631.1 hypothetical protein KY384_007784 [Bacidia gigantensis]
MASKSYRKSQLIAFDNAAAGHDGVLSDPAGSIIIKPCKQSEIDFYESTSAHEEILPYIAGYKGRLSLGDTAQAAGAFALPGETSIDEPAKEDTATLPVVNHAWKPSGGGKIQTDLALVLDNIAAGFKKPNILDIKLGARLWDDDAPEEKRVKLDKVAEETTSKSLGFRIAGMKTFQGNETTENKPIAAEGYKVFDKHYGREFDAVTVHRAFEDFFLTQEGTRPIAPIRKVIRRFIRDLTGMVGVLEAEESRMYSASLLFVYEGDAHALRSAFTEEASLIANRDVQKHHQVGNAKLVPSAASATVEAPAEADDEGSIEDERPAFPAIDNVKLIDFAHARWAPGKGSDENVLFGIRNVAQKLQDLVG